MRSPKAAPNCAKLVINTALPGAVGTSNLTSFAAPVVASRATRLIVLGTTPMKPAVLVLTPVIAWIWEGTSWTYTPGERNSAIAVAPWLIAASGRLRGFLADIQHGLFHQQHVFHPER